MLRGNIMADSLTLDEWSVGYYDAMAAAAKIRQSMHRQASVFTIARYCWRATSGLRNLTSLMNQLAKAPEEQLRELLFSAKELHRSCTDVLTLAASKGLMNRMLTAVALQSLSKNNDKYLDVIERYELSLDRTISEEARQALEEYSRGEATSLKSLV